VIVEREPWLGAEVLSYPQRPRTVVDVLDGAVAAFGDRVALRAPEGDLTYGEFAEAVEGAVERLREEGLQAGDRLAVAARNGLDLAVALFACARGGFVMVGLNLRLRAPQWAYMLRHSGARMALAQPEALDELRAAADEAGLATTAVRDVGDHLRGRRRPWSYGAAQQPDEAAAFAVVYTSGTTGRPKASRVVHRCSVHSAMSYVEVVGLAGDDRTAVLFPLYYISGLHAHVLPMMLVGGCSVLVADASAHEFVTLLARERITWMYTVPSMWQLLLREDGFTASVLPDLRRGAFGGSPFPPAMLDSIRQRLPRLRLTDIYGLSETHSPATMLRDEEFATKRGSVGRPLPCMEAKIIDDAGQEVPAGEPGELLLRGSLVTTGYDGDEEATRAAIRAGWLHTGDLARLDRDGYVFILDRKKDMITRGGNKIFSVEVEQLLLTHPGVADVAVFGIPDPIAFEAVAAYVVPMPGAQLTRRDVQRWVAERMSDYAVPRQVRVVDEIPRNRTGKILKTDLRRRLLDELGHPRRAAEGGDHQG
jgi:acyl-CoA synthetase (AMP-forming)/AMP-acid ligase II